MSRPFQLLNGKWKFSIDLDDVGETEGWFSSSHMDNTWLTVDVPSNWDYYFPELFGYTGVGWFKRSFYLSKEYAGQCLFLRFNGVNYSAKIWVNNILVNLHEGGFIPFEIDITDKAVLGQDNILAIKVENIPSENKVPSSLAGWWNFGGIYRDISLEVRNSCFIDNVYVVAQPDGDDTQLTLRFKVRNKGTTPFRGKMENNIVATKEKENVEWAEEPISVKVEVPSNEILSNEMKVRIKGNKKWSLKNPCLYVLKSCLLSFDGKILDSLSTCFGVRTVAIEDGKLTINGEPIKIKGVNRHEEFFKSGRSDKQNATKNDLEIVKALGANMVRIHYYCDPRFYDLADELGLLVFTEIPFWGISKTALMDQKVVENAKGQLTALVNGLKNHPSVVVWSVGNECESDNEVARSVIGELVQFVKEMDSTRPVTYVSNHIHDEDKWCRCLDLGDFTSINAYFGLGILQLDKVLEKIHTEYPDRAVLVTEFGDEAARGVHGGMKGSEEYQAKVIEKTWNLITNKNFIMGGLVWSFTDYWHQPRRLGSRYLNPVYFLHGILDVERMPKESFKVLRKLFLTKV